MQRIKTLVLIGCLVLLGASIVPQVQADEYHKKILTFDEPVQLPGIVLPAGSYIFKLVTPMLDHNVVQVFNSDKSRLLATILAIPNYSLKTPENTTVAFEERGADAPKAIKAWFSSGDSWGQEFVYPKTSAVELANQNRQKAPAMPSETVASVPMPEPSPEEQAIKTEPFAAIEPSEPETQMAEVVSPKDEEVPAIQAPSAVASQPARIEELPKTASPLFLIGLAGVISTAGGFALRFFSKQKA
jgi:hypothetical protein